MDKYMKLTILAYVSMVILFYFPASNVANAESPRLPNPTHGGELTVAMNNAPIHLNPALQSGNLTGLIGAQIFAGLLRFDRQGRPQPYLAREWSVSKDGLTVTLKLVANATFHDGVPITSADVAFSIMTVKAQHPFKSMFEAVDRVETPDASTVVIKLSRPHPAILTALAPILLPILPRHIYGDGQDLQTHPANWAPVGSGPYRCVEFIPDKHIKLERYDGFFLPGKPYLDTITFKIYLDPREIPLALEQNDVQFYSFAPLLSESLMLESEEHLTVTNDGYQAIGPLMWLAFNLDRKPFDDLRVRQAFAHAIDRDFIVSTIFNGMAQKATGPISPDNPFYSDQVPAYEVNVAKANALLDEAGFIRQENGKRFTVNVDYLPDEASVCIPLLKYLKQDFMRKLGVELSLRPSRDFTEWANRVSQGDFQATLDIVFNWSDPVIGVHRTYDSKNIRPGLIWSNTQNYRNPEVDALLAEAGVEMDFSRRKKLYARFQNKVVLDLPVFWISTVPYMTIYKRDLVGVNDDFWGSLAPFDNFHWRSGMTK